MSFLDIKIDNIKNVYSLQRKKDDVRNMQNRISTAILVIENGMISYYQDGVEYVQTPDTAIVLPQGTTYSLYCHEDAKCYMVNFDELTDFIGSKIMTIKLVHKKDIVDKFDKMCRIWSMRSYSYKHKLMSIMYSILADITEDIVMDKHQIRYYEIIKPSIKFMEEHYSDCDIKNDDLAKISNISTVYFRKIFTKLYGVSPIRYIEIRKIEKAKELLDTEELSVTEIAAITGFSDIYHFCHSFKKITGFSPNKYRNRI